MDKNFRNIPLKLSYDSGLDDILWDFYIPVLSMAKTYDRIAGFFSSSSLALSARGLEEFLSNGGKMRLVTCPQLSKQDVEMLERASKNLGQIITDNFIKDYSEIETQFQKDHVQALGWMLAKGKLEIKIAVIKRNGKICDKEQIEQLGIMHQKVGILHDKEGQIISFSGSNNESALGWLGNTEEFKVFCSWTGAMPYVQEDIKKFNSFWNVNRPDVEIKNIPDALNEHLIKISKDFEPSIIATKHYYPKGVATQKEELKLFYYQKNAVNKWEETGRMLLLQMATGCGKTRTAIGCMNKALKDTNKLLVVIACPQATLSSQWKNDVERLDIEEHRSIEINGNITGWETLIRRNIGALGAGRYRNLVVYTTHQIASSIKFTELLNKSSPQIIKFLIGDEVHGMGADRAQNGLLDVYKYRLGLSATPQRWFDESGSRLIEEYFGNNNFEFSIHDALTNINPITGKPFLVNYTYEPRFISLTEDELEEYKRITEKIVKQSKYANDEEASGYLDMLRFKRANIEKNAENKYTELECILDEIGNHISDTIIFVSDAQIDRVMQILGRRGIVASRFTQAQGTSVSEKYDGLSEREHIIKMFKEKQYQVLVAIKCLDEGIDIPSADRAIVMASSTNPREYVQRIGRIIRQTSGKYQATIHDMIIKPSLDMFYDDALIEMEKRIFKKEMDRVLELSENALNNTSVTNIVFDILEEVLS